MMEKLYTIGFSKALDQLVGFGDRDKSSTRFQLDGVMVNDEKMDVLFCKNEKGIFAIAAKYRSGSASRCGGRWHGGRGYYDVYYRKNFKSPEEGNEFYKTLKKTLENTNEIKWK